RRRAGGPLPSGARPPTVGGGGGVGGRVAGRRGREGPRRARVPVAGVPGKVSLRGRTGQGKLRRARGPSTTPCRPTPRAPAAPPGPVVAIPPVRRWCTTGA